MKQKADLKYENKVDIFVKIYKINKLSKRNC